MRRLYVLFVMMLISLGGTSTEYQSPTRKLTLSSGYLERVFNSNKALVDFPLTAIDGYGALFDVATNSINEKWWSRLIISIVELPFGYWFSNSIFVPFHEFGHARSFHASGRDYRYTTKGYGKTLSGISTYWILSLARLVTPPFFFPGSGPASVGSLDKASINSELADYWGRSGSAVVRSAGGLNNQSLLAKVLAQEIYQRHGHVTQTIHYLMNKISGWGYSFLDRKSALSNLDSRSDITSILEAYKEKGYAIKHADIELQSLISLLSGTTFSLLRGYYTYVANGDARVYPAELFGVRIPDINSYINARGLSLEFVSGYRVNPSLLFDLAYEFVWKGDSAHQVTPSVHFELASLAPKVNSLWINTDVVFGKGIGGAIGAEWMPFSIEDKGFWNHFSYFADVTVYNGFNLYGERNITSLRQGRTVSVDAFAGARFNY